MATYVSLCFSSQALRQLRQISQEVSQPNVTGWGRRPAALRALGQRLSRLVYFSLVSRLSSLSLIVILMCSIVTMQRLQRGGQWLH